MNTPVISEPQSAPAEFSASSQDERLVIRPKESRVVRSNLIPDAILHDEFLQSLVTNSLPKNYNFEVYKTIWKIKQINAKRIILQLPEGLIRFGTVLVDVMKSYLVQNGHADVNFIIMGDLTYGACCIDDYLASSMGCDLIVHYAHSCLVPINRLNNGVKYLYIFLDIKFDLDHLVSCVKHNFDPSKHNLAIASTIQFVSSVHELGKILKKSQYNVTIPQSRPLSPGEVLGCTAPKLDESVNTILFICDGRFHLEALMIANPQLDAYRYDPYSRTLTRECYSFDDMYQQRSDAMRVAFKTMQSKGTIGFILGTLGRQGSEKVFDRLIELLEKYTECRYLKVMMPEVAPDVLQQIESVEVWVQIACPRLSIDWGSAAKKPLLNPYEFAKTIRAIIDTEKVIDDKKYPMDFYATNSIGDHTPNHACARNEACSCIE